MDSSSWGEVASKGRIEGILLVLHVLLLEAIDVVILSLLLHDLPLVLGIVLSVFVDALQASFRMAVDASLLLLTIEPVKLLNKV